MGTYTQIIYQIIFSTKFRNPCMIKSGRDLLFRDIRGVLNNKKCHVYHINGVEDHLHIVTDLHPTVNLSSLVKDIKLGSSDFIKRKCLFPGFTNWQKGYSAFTYNIREKERLVQYVRNQEQHHKNISFEEELIFLLKKHNIPFEKKYLFDG